MTDNCMHDTVIRQPVMDGHGHIWACSSCTGLFLPVDAVAQIEEENDRILDLVVGVFSATLWDLHERSFAGHGVPLPASDPLTEQVCEEKGHERDETGVCTRCGHSPFLGDA